MASVTVINDTERAFDSVMKITLKVIEMEDRLGRKTIYQRFAFPKILGTTIERI
jgi:hypothetical protein